MSGWFSVKVGLSQGYVISPWLFNYERVQGKHLARGSEIWYGRKNRQGEWPVDTAWMAESESNLQRNASAFVRVCERRKLKINVGKSK